MQAWAEEALRMRLETGTVEEHRETGGGYRVLVLRCPSISDAVKPGQFVHLRVPALAERVLRRPFSVYRAVAGTISILYKRVGAGTAAMCRLRTGEAVDLLGPLGNGFPPPSAGAMPVVVAGGYGMAALCLVAERAGSKGIAFAGGAGAADILCADEFRRLGWEVRVATEDGSAGSRGLVTDILNSWLEQCPGSLTPEFFVCGPMGLLRAIAARVAATKWKAWLSLDRNMGCGLGACLACVQKVRSADAAQGWKWARICTEGPVFESRQVVWE